MADQGTGDQITRTPLRRFLLVVIWLTALAAPIASIAFLLYENLLTPGATQPLIGTYDGFYWDAAQLQIAYTRFEEQLLRYRNGMDTGNQTLLLRYHLLQSKVRVLQGSTRILARQAALAQHQQTQLEALSKELVALRPDLDAPPGDNARIDHAIDVLESHWEEVNDLALSRRIADVDDREALNRDFIAKRRAIFAGGLLLLLLSTAATVLLVMNGRRRTRLIRQQRAALEAEHQASRAARDASRAKDAFLGMISHELRTPLHAIVSSIELLGFHEHSEEDRKVIQRLDTAGRHLEAQMRDLTDYARLGAGKLELRHEHVDPRVLLASIVDEHEPAARLKGLTLESGMRGGPGNIDSDPHRIRQIVSNLVTNAIRYTEKGTVRVHFDQQPTLLTIVVRDTGPGVPQEKIPLIFEEFTQLDASRSRRFEGAGMGLAIVQGLVALFGGTVSVESRVGEGTTFTVVLPAVAVPAPVDEVPSGAAMPGREDGRRPHALVIDDNPLVRESLREMLAHMEWDVTAAGNAGEALEALDFGHFDVLLLDLHMPGVDGFAFLERFHARDPDSMPTPPGVPVIAVSALAPDGEDAAAFFDYLVKPVHYDVLRDALRRALSARRAG
ncbi:hybrid sensor histidine kinase/response regulator [Paraburkholderia phosphatilytica]|uniref:ATP-binding response regulator n=1 Tax=Paraburkholderia phosphatilytica TaxID=2282883 RepID=UPI000E51465D|nr:ATP-binding protein [Paraburkholderia phosphatilytica]